MCKSVALQDNDTVIIRGKKYKIICSLGKEPYLRRIYRMVAE